MKLFLFEGSEQSPLDQTVQFFTGDNIRHAAMSFEEFTGNELLFEANGWQGKSLAFRDAKKLVNRPATVIEFDLPVEIKQKCFQRACSLIPRSYDFLGFFGFPINRENPKKVYCFEYVLKVLIEIPMLTDMSVLVKDGSVSGKDLYKLCQQLKDNIKVGHRL